MGYLRYLILYNIIYEKLFLYISFHKTEKKDFIYNTYIVNYFNMISYIFVINYFNLKLNVKSFKSQYE